MKLHFTSCLWRLCIEMLTNAYIHESHVYCIYIVHVLYVLASLYFSFIILPFPLLVFGMLLLLHSVENLVYLLARTLLCSICHAAFVHQLQVHQNHPTRLPCRQTWVVFFFWLGRRTQTLRAIAGSKGIPKASATSPWCHSCHAAGHKREPIHRVSHRHPGALPGQCLHSDLGMVSRVSLGGHRHVLAVVDEGADVHYVRLLKDKTCTLGGVREIAAEIRAATKREVVQCTMDLRSRH